MTNEQIKARDLYNQVQENKEKIRELRDNKKIEQAYNLMNENKKLELELFDIEDRLEEEEREMHINNKVDNYTSQFLNYVREGAPIENASGVMKAGENGAILPVEISKKIIEKLQTNSDLLKYCEVLSLPGDLKFPIEGDGAICDYIDEDMEGEDSKITFGTKELLPSLASALVNCSKSLLYNANFNLSAYIEDMFIKKMGEFVSNQLVMGDGEAQDVRQNHFEGLVNTKNVYNMPLEPTIDNFIDMELQMPTVASKKAVWIMSTEMFKKVKKMKDKEDRYYLIKDTKKQSSTGVRLLGHPVEICEDLNNDVLFVNFDGIKVNLREFSTDRLNETMATRHMIQFLLFFAGSSIIVNEQLVVKGTQVL